MLAEKNMAQFTHIIFDLDGTLGDLKQCSGFGLTGSEIGKRNKRKQRQECLIFKFRQIKNLTNAAIQL